MLLRKVVACSKAHDKGCSSLDFPRKSLDELNKVILIGAERTHAMSFFLPPHLSEILDIIAIFNVCF